MSKELKSYIFTEKKETCTGCGACVQLCGKDALSMQADAEGFLFPILDTDKCVKCGICDARCPVVNDRSNQSSIQRCYIGTTDRKDYYEESASIGICTMLSDYVISKGGVVYGAYLDESDWSVYHVCVSDKNGVQRIRNSKYAQSSTKNTFSEVKSRLLENKIVLYIGTPCQIAGLKAYLNKDYKTLYTIDLICHGVFSPILLPLEINYWEQLFSAKIKNFRFRSKRVFKSTNGGMVNFDIIKDDKLKHIERFAGSSPTYHCYAYSRDGSNYNLRISCYNCVFKSKSRYADITIGDPWFINDSTIKDSKLTSQNIVRSLYSGNTSKGLELISHINHMLYKKEFLYKDIFLQPAVRLNNRFIPNKREYIYSNICKEDYGALVESLFECNLENEHINFVKSYRLKQIKEFVKHLIFYYKWKK